MSLDNSATMNREQIQAAIPHRAPMLLIDEVVDRTSDKIVCRKTFRDDEFFFQGHYPDYPLVPGVILCEAGMQAGAVLLSGLLSDDGVPVATHLSEARFRKMVRPGDTVQIEVDLVERVSTAFYMKAKITRDGATIMRFQFTCTMTAKVPD